MKKIFAISLTAVILPTFGYGQEADDINAGMRVEHDYSTGTNTVSWWAKQDHAYFILTSQDLTNWLYINEIFLGEESIEDTFNFTLSGGGDKAFFKLQFTNTPINIETIAELDLDGDGISNQAELDNGTDPFSALDISGNGIPDDADNLWANVSTAWKELIVNSSNAFIYDPEGSIASVNDISPIDDYDGDGLSNLQEYLNGTPADDFYNGNAPEVYIVAGNYQKSEPNTISNIPLVVLVLDSDQKKLNNAPVVFSINSGGGALSLDEQGISFANQVVVRTYSSSRNSSVYYRQPSEIDTHGTVNADAGSTTVTFSFDSIETESSSIPANATNFSSVLNLDGSKTLTWEDAATNEHYYTIFINDEHGRSWAAGVAPENSESYTVPAAVVNNLP